MEPKQATNQTPSNEPQGQQPSPVDWTPYVPKGAEKVFEPYKGKGIDDIFNSFVEAQRAMGGSIRLPKPDAKPEDRAKAMQDIYRKLGAPESPDKYDLGELPTVGERFQWDDNRLNTAKSELHKLGLTNDQAKGVLGLFANELKQFYPDPVAQAHESKAKLVEEYGSEQLFNRNLTFASQAVKEFGGEELAGWLEQTGLGNHPAFIKMMAKIGRELVEHGATEPADGDLFMSSADAQKKIDTILSDKSDLYYSRLGTPGRDARIKEVQDLFRIVNGEV